MGAAIAAPTCLRGLTTGAAGSASAMPWLAKALLLALKTKRGRELLLAGGMGAIEVERSARARELYARRMGRSDGPAPTAESRQPRANRGRPIQTVGASKRGPAKDVLSPYRKHHPSRQVVLPRSSTRPDSSSARCSNAPEGLNTRFARLRHVTTVRPFFEANFGDSSQRLPNMRISARWRRTGT